MNAPLPKIEWAVINVGMVVRHNTLVLGWPHDVKGKKKFLHYCLKTDIFSTHFPVFKCTDCQSEPPKSLKKLIEFWNLTVKI